MYPAGVFIFQFHLVPLVLLGDEDKRLIGFGFPDNVCGLGGLFSDVDGRVVFGGNHDGGLQSRGGLGPFLSGGCWLFGGERRLFIVATGYGKEPNAYQRNKHNCDAPYSGFSAACLLIQGGPFGSADACGNTEEKIERYG